MDGLLENRMIYFVACLVGGSLLGNPLQNCEAYFPADSLSVPLSMGSGKYADFV